LAQPWRKPWSSAEDRPGNHHPKKSIWMQGATGFSEDAKRYSRRETIAAGGPWEAASDVKREVKKASPAEGPAGDVNHRGM
jgi:hypothetical protein